MEVQPHLQPNTVQTIIHSVFPPPVWDSYSFTSFSLLDSDYYELDVFKKFKNSNGEFKKSIIKDVRGILSLYEASFMSVHGEDILDEALEFTREYQSRGLAYISSMKKKNLQMNPTRICKIRFQSSAIIAERGAQGDGKFEPHLALSRMMMAKYLKMISLADDTCDAYATMKEVNAFTDAIERCSIDATDELPDYMKVFYKELLNLFEETENIASKEGRSYCAYYVKEEAEQKRGDSASSVECYMKEHDVLEKKAVEEILKICANAWKDINEECMKPTALPSPILQLLVNLARITEVVYRFDDSYTNPSSLKDKITALLLEPLPLQDQVNI
ncbi:hypothetical protein GH714_004059 [Hevea brasiliensis]|uniref:Terpene synthase N-terminal domain-containing protein n=1 Tax=Hevea brasiliensis TaxID=3981 RepID=A0A6A6MAS3_HEVBR|nr:hypothetical protein GH714_004059 [Hevea brasiliensis]